MIGKQISMWIVVSVLYVVSIGATAWYVLTSGHG
jgi:hypothetical protein